ncbi:hypothetical protein [Bacillus xiapuensis]|uniref:Uncharacterized protein n=1 Tax=Bacillus xiapuensis TaxID=2014075 RepID=A0ABU6N7T4_9BACI|nr:hypothetical protein [Bacillus xiapuensis]
MGVVAEKVNQVLKEYSLKSSETVEILLTLRKQFENQVKGVKVDVR